MDNRKTTPNPATEAVVIDSRYAVIETVLLERERQESLCREGVHKFTCSDPAIPNLRKFPILLEEVGKVGTELEFLSGTDDKLDQEYARDRLRDELTQVAAVTIAWLESLEKEDQ